MKCESYLQHNVVLTSSYEKYEQGSNLVTASRCEVRTVVCHWSSLQQEIFLIPFTDLCSNEIINTKENIHCEN